jgi:hemerythrin-like domain-containing protein
MASEAGQDTLPAQERAVAIIQAEHRALGHVVRALQKVTDEIAQGLAEADFVLLASMLYYIDSFPEQFHHPKEDEHLFLALRRRTSKADGVLDELQAEHVRSAQTIAYLNQTLVHYQGGAADGLRQFRDAVNAYAALLLDHMRKEEQVVLPLAAEFLRPADWEAMAAAFAANEDPLFGERQQQAFRRLQQRIANLVPRKLKPLLREDGG